MAIRAKRGKTRTVVGVAVHGDTTMVVCQDGAVFTLDNTRVADSWQERAPIPGTSQYFQKMADKPVKARKARR